MTKTSEKTDFIIQRMRLRNSEKTFLLLRRYKGNESVVTIPDGVEKIGDNVFADDIEPNETITKIIIPDSVLEISEKAFAWCKSLKEIEFPKAIKSFCISFATCPKMKEIFVPESVEEIGFPSTKQNYHIGENIRRILFVKMIKQDSVLSSLKKWICAQFANNPAYILQNDFFVNKKHRSTLFYMNTSEEANVPEGIETVSTTTFYEFLLDKDSVPVKKVYLPGSVKKIEYATFLSCSHLVNVTYDGLFADLDICKWGFFTCLHFGKDGREITCKDRKPKVEKLGKGLQFERIIFIHHVFKNGGCMNKNQLQKLLKDTFGEEKLSISTIGRDIDFLRDRFKAPIVFSRDRNGYYYTDLTFSIDAD
ncbi:leucine-rich repeat domain-containing protein [Treponema zioleckii]|uniref:leucine-rich repeat domain-containing protein n=1 Tax=Treponema zioleckii TaxID=331680 RepID=UPI00168BEE69|nr:leucine-rich repeat domain-containing protein [Treponema zioleckii]